MAQTAALKTFTVGLFFVGAAGASMSPTYAKTGLAPYAETRDVTNPWSLGSGYDTAVVQLDFSEMVASLRDNGFPVTMIADLMKVERKSVYAWISGTQPRQDARERLSDAYPVLDDAFGGQFKTMHRVWRIKDADGITLAKLCAADQIDAVALKKFLAGIAPTIRRYAKLDANSKPAVGGRNPLLDDFPVADIGGL
jgi:hypothetical protein